MGACLLVGLVSGVSAILHQWRLTEAACAKAVANSLEARQLLTELIRASQIAPLVGYRPAAPSINALQKAAGHAEKLLSDNPADVDLRIALYVRLWLPGDAPLGAATNGRDGGRLSECRAIMGIAGE